LNLRLLRPERNGDEDETLENVVFPATDTNACTTACTSDQNQSNLNLLLTLISKLSDTERSQVLSLLQDGPVSAGE